MPENKPLTGYPSIDKPWLKYYSEEAINAPLPECTVYEYLWENNKDHLDDVALIYFGRTISYRELFRNIDNTTTMLLNVGVRTGDVVSIIAITSPEIIYLFYSLSKIGAIANMLDPRMSLENLTRLINDASSRYLFVVNVFGYVVDEIINKCHLKTVIEVDIKQSMKSRYRIGFYLKYRRRIIHSKNAESWNAEIQKASDMSCGTVSARPELPALIEYTGGTTGFPKGVLLSNSNINAVAEQYRRSGVCLNRGDLWQCIAAPFIAYVMIVSTHIPLSSGITCKISIYDPDKIAADIIHNEYNHISGNPAVWAKVIRSRTAKNKDFSKLIMPITGADEISIPLWQEINDFLAAHHCVNFLCNGYGMTELASAVCVNLSKEIGRIGSVGIPFIKTAVAAFDVETNKELPYDNIGEICISGPSIMIGYLNNQLATNEVIRLHSDGKKWLHTGDLGHIDQDGFIFIDGRIKRMIVRENGAKVFPSEVERVVLEIPEVMDCVVVSKKESDTSLGSVPVAYVVIQGSNNRDEIKSEILSHCKKELQNYAIPRYIQIIEDIPLTPVGKIDYRALEKQAEVMIYE